MFQVKRADDFIGSYNEKHQGYPLLIPGSCVNGNLKENERSPISYASKYTGPIAQSIINLDV